MKNSRFILNEEVELSEEAKTRDSRLPGWGVTGQCPQRPRLPALPSRDAASLACCRPHRG